MGKLLVINKRTNYQKGLHHGQMPMRYPLDESTPNEVKTVI